MKTIVRWLALAVVVSLLGSCGLPGAAVRSAGRLAQAAGGLLGPAAGLAL
jgi:hypothetical protein